FDEAFATRLVNRFSTVQVMRERIERMMMQRSVEDSFEADLATIREVLDTSVNRRKTETINKFADALGRVQQVFDEVNKAIGGSLSVSQTGWSVTSERGQNTLFFSRLGLSDRILSVTYEILPAGEELLVRLAGETVYRT